MSLTLCHVQGSALTTKFIYLFHIFKRQGSAYQLKVVFNAALLRKSHVQDDMLCEYV